MAEDAPGKRRVTIPAPIWRPSNNQYHSSEGWSSTMLKTFRDSPLLAYRQYVTKEIEPEEPSLAMLEGSAVHLLITEPDRAQEEMVKAECDVRRGKAWTEVKLGNPGRIVLPRPSWHAAHAMARAILEPRTEMAELAKALLCSPGGYGEYAHRWTEIVSGVEIRCRLKLDHIRAIAGLPVKIELKSTRDPEPEAFGRFFEDLEYHAQAAFYDRGIMTIPEIAGPVRAFGYTSPPTIVVAVGNEEPHAVSVRQVPDDTMAEGARIIEHSLSRLADCLTFDRWCHPWERVLSADIPKLPRAPWRVKRQAEPQMPITADPF